MYNTTSANISAMWKNHWGNTQGSTARIENMTRSYHFMKPGPRARLEMRIGESATFKRKKKKKKIHKRRLCRCRKRKTANMCASKSWT